MDLPMINMHNQLKSNFRIYINIHLKEKVENLALISQIHQLIRFAKLHFAHKMKVSEAVLQVFLQQAITLIFK